jgi:hypothetical protein
MLALALVPQAAATPPQPQTYTMMGQLTGPTTVSGTWTGKGLVNASGTYTEIVRFAGKSIHVEKIFRNSNGTFVLRGRGVVNWVDSCTATFRAGSWRISDGTGVYAGVRGGGTPVATTTSYANVCTGTVVIVHEGAVHAH